MLSLLFIVFASLYDFQLHVWFSKSFHIWIIDVKEKTTGFAIGFVLPRVLLETFKVKLLEQDHCAVAWQDWRVYSLCRTVQKTSGQEGRRSAHASTRAKTRLGVRQNTGPLPLAASVQYTAGTPLLRLLCRNRIHYQDTGFRRGCRDKRSGSRHHQPAPAVSICLELQPSCPGLWSVHTDVNAILPLSGRPKTVKRMSVSMGMSGWLNICVTLQTTTTLVKLLI